jgi:Ser/Thr protein kinase RdoA (MazF antagonist)
MRWAEALWERVVPSPVVDDAFLDAHLGAWPELRRRRWRALGGGLRHATLRSDDVVARIALVPDPPLAREAALLERLGGAIRVPRVLDRRDGVLLLEHVEHEDLPATSEAVEAAGRALSRIHECRLESAGMLGADLAVVDPFPDPFVALREWAERGFAGDAGLRLGPLADRLRAAWDSSRDAIERASATPVLLHGDYKPANVKWLARERDVLVLDWEFAWSGPALMDVGQFLRWEESADLGAAFLRAALGGDASDDRDAARTSRLLDLFNLVGLLDHRDPAPIRDRDVVTRIVATLEGLERADDRRG